MKLIICDNCGKVIENYKENINKSTIVSCDYDLCDFCVNDILRNMKFPDKDNEKQFIEQVTQYGVYDIKKKKEIVTDDN